jgi:5-(carboxyamino)imidazole ribonucleotide mutase
MADKANPLVLIVMGSDSDLPAVKPAAETLDALGLPHEMHVASAHRTPERATALAAQARGRGLKVIIAAAGGAAHLAGVLAAHTTLPVIGVPIASASGTLDGMDALLATVQMPGGVPVATVAINGARNAALLAAEIIATGDEALAAKLDAMRKDMADKVQAADAKLKEGRP